MCCVNSSGRHWIHASAGREGVITEVDANIDVLAVFIWEQIDLARRKALLPSWKTREEAARDRPPTWEIKVGRMRTSPEQVHIVLQHPDVMIFEIDLSSKYPGEFTYVSYEDVQRVIIHPGDHSIKLDDGAVLDTEFILRGAQDWTLIAEGSRYTVRIAAYKRGPEA